MKKLNNKGLTITELLVSVALVSVVMLFLYRMLADVTFQKDNDFFASNNQEQRIEIIDKIERLINADETNISGYVVDNGGKRIVINAAHKTIAIELTSDASLWILDGVSVKYQWRLNGAKFTAINPIDCESIADDSGHFNKTLVECKIRVSTTNTNNNIKDIGGKIVNNNNTLDDIEFSFMY